MDAALESFLVNAGILGPILVAVGWYVLRLGKDQRELLEQLQEVQEKRTTDAQGVTERLLSITDRLNDVQKETQLALSQNTSILVELKDAIRESLRRDR